MLNVLPKLCSFKDFGVIYRLMVQFRFCLEKETAEGRVGSLETPHGKALTPLFMPVGSHGSVKALSPRELEELCVEVVLANAYHLYLRPGVEVIRDLGGLHAFMGWKGPILTDSGGYQIFSLCKLVRLMPEGVEFRSHLDGSLHLFTPERAIEVQEALGADIIMSLDVCLPYPSEKGRVQEAVELTTRWARRGKGARKGKAALFGIVQGGVFLDLRRKSAEALMEMGFDGYALGGLSVGEEKRQTWEVVEFTCGLLPQDQPRYLMGMGTPEDLVEGVRRGVDMFDCVLPTRCARTGELFTPWGKMNIKNARYARDPDPIDPGCDCYTCRHFSRAYLRHLFMARELLAYYLNTIHNLHYYLKLMREIRRALQEDRFEEFRREFYRLREEGATEVAP